MRPSDVRYGRRQTLTLKALDERSVPLTTLRGSEVLLHRGTSGESLLYLPDRVVKVDGRSAADRDRLQSILDHNPPSLVWLIRVLRDTGGPPDFIIMHLSLAHRQALEEPISIAVGDIALDDIRRRSRLGSATNEALLAWLVDQVVIQGNPLSSLNLDTAASIPASRVIATGLEPDALERGVGFRLHGRDLDVDVGLSDGRLSVIRLAPISGARERTPTLVTASVQIVDWSHAALFRAEGVHELLDILAGDAAYLNLWRQYYEREVAQVNTLAQRIGLARYDRRRLHDDAWRFMLEGPSGADFLVRIAAEDDLLLAASDHSPSAIATERVEEWSPPTFDGVVRTIDFAARSVELMSVETMSGPGTVNQPPSSGYLHFSFRPERSRLRRQRQALDRVTSGTAEMPFLGLLLEGRDPGNSARRDISTLSAATRRSFGAKPTAMQEEALRVALNTPDLALVQGPPGTGKTQVLSALQVRLAELDEDSGRLGQSTLLSSFQHDAVEHAVSRTSVLGLPAWKIGERSGTPSSSMSRPLPTLAQWRKSLVEAVRADLGGRDHPTTLLHRIDLAITRLTLELTTEEEQEAILHAVEAVVLGLIPATLVRRLADAIEAGERVPLVREREPAGITRAVEALKAIPCEPATFLPHGPELATKALLLVERTARAEPSLVEALAVLADWLEDEPPVTGKLDVVELIAENLATAANRDLPTPEPVGPSHTAERVEVLEEVREAVATYLDTTLSGAERALAHYAEDLELDDEGVERVMREYAVVLAATCQQAASKVMYETKGHDLRFENVIIDEAARANPLDLLIPLTLATRRVVLVGDHRQLPHLLEPDVEDAMAMDLGEDAAVALRASLFERLFEQLRELELRTGIKRVVTLDKQYRMHPILGQFVSEAFYGSPDAILAGRAAGEFAHKLAAYEGKVAAWADLPISRGPEKGRRSRERPCEAEWIAGEVVRISQENPSLTIGVVTFYAAQRSRLLRALKEREVVEETAEGYRMRREYSLRETPTGLVEPLRIGTVDAFQGMEFDVVILSVVRSNDYPGASERERRRKWGFLLLENRMCVAMSRQRRLLVVVGDPTMAEGSDASEAVPGLSRFRQLCLSEVGRVIRP